VFGTAKRQCAPLGPRPMFRDGFGRPIRRRVSI